ncbi:hypothetical protein BDV97DRAFT_396768 [Delphinella strobiligena]|nr:hypothetical protein BDV97DRAFT_396768 [Delphinella strobiligena]
MKDFTILLALPASIITLLSSLPPAYSEPWTHHLAPHERYFPEHELQIKRGLEIQQKLAISPPAGMRKMSGDEGEKFFMEYWQFDCETPEAIAPDGQGDKLGKSRASQSNLSFHNGSDSHTCGLLPPVLPHSDKKLPSYLPRIFARGLFERDFKCPTGTSNCTSIGQPDACCATGETCVTVTDTGNGPVGCCPAGDSCSDEVVSCNTADGYSSCPGSSNGGCCIPGYSCQGVGCIYVGTSTTTTTLPTATVTTGATTEGQSVSTTTTTTSPAVSAASVGTSRSVQTVTTTIVSTPSAGVTTVTQVIIITPSTTTTSTTPTTTSISTTTTNVSACTSGYNSCPASLGGGCCPTDRSCASSNLCLETATTTTTLPSPLSTTTATSTTAPSAAVRPTSGSASSNTVSSLTSTVTYTGCPTGFFMCSAYYLGGCCRVGRNCDTTSCPPSASTSVIVTSGLTIVAGGSATAATTTAPSASGSGSVSTTESQGNCASGWFACGAAQGGGCCPSGFACGTSCTAPASASGQADVGKENYAYRCRGLGWGVLVLGLVSGIGMVVL